MVFNSLAFTVFFSALFFLYWFVCNRNIKVQNLLILAASYFFYAWWDWRFLSLLAGSSLLTFFLGIWIHQSQDETKRKWLLYTGLLQGLGGLLFFKYYNFFVTSFTDAFAALHVKLNIHTLNIILPLGISFYTFRTISYLLDIDKGKIKPTTDWIVYFSYIAFFPSLVSGPIDRAKTLIPQLEKKRTFDYEQAADGLRQILWGLFKKIVVADNCASFVNQFFDNYKVFPASSLLLGIFFFTIQVYADFSGYSDMAIGFSRLLGFSITKNFEFPFFAQNIAEFWRKWHISLTTWLTDYVFAPLTIAFRNYGKAGLILAILINFLAVGIWHGANWTFILFGFLHGCYYIPLIIKGTINKRKKIAKDKIFPSLVEFKNIAGTFLLVMFTFVIFRADNLSQAFRQLGRIFSRSLFTIPHVPAQKLNGIFAVIFTVILLLVEWLQREKQHALQLEQFKSPVLRMSVYYALICIIIFCGEYSGNQFIYVKF